MPCLLVSIILRETTLHGLHLLCYTDFFAGLCPRLQLLVFFQQVIDRALLPFSPKRLPAPFLRRVPALVRSPALVTVSRSRVTAHFPRRGIPFQTVIRFSRGLSIDELSQVYTFLIACAVYPRGRKSARKTHYFHALGFVI